MKAPLPSDLEAERSLLGAVMIRNEAIDETNLPDAAFYHPHHRAAWRTARELRAANQPIDPITIANAVTGWGSSALGELRSKLTAILAEGSITSLVPQHAASVRECWVTRNALLIAAHAPEMVERGVRGGELLSSLLGDLGAIQTEQPETAIGVARLAFDRAKDIWEHTQGKVREGFSTGIERLDSVLGGLQPGIVTIGAGRPGMGKSAFAMGVTMANARGGVGAHVFSLEDTRSAYGDRVLARITGIPAEDMRNGRAVSTRGGFGKIRDRLNQLKGAELPWIVDDRSGIDAHEIVRSVRQHRASNKTEVVIVDYVQLLRRPMRSSMHEHMGEQITILADAAKQDRMAYLVLSQLNRGLERREDKRPLLSDLRESGSLEERAKCVIGLYRPHEYDNSAPENEIELHVLKNSQGQTGVVNAHWHGPTTTIS